MSYCFKLQKHLHISPLFPTITTPVYAKLAYWEKVHALQHECFWKRNYCYWHKGNPFDEKEYESDVESDSSDTINKLSNSDNAPNKSKDSGADPKVDVIRSEKSSSTTEITPWIHKKFGLSDMSM